ncbi:FGFR1 oncogene partner 2 isoform X2 [Colius striatus]|nr:FGFR1 oncogene partner 2 isoform X2 [Colius striatus]
MSCTIEKALADAKALVERLREHDNAAEALIEQTTALNKRVEAMKQYQEEIQELNEVARHRPRSTLVMGIQQENRQIRELQQENKELRTSLEEHQSALELIMSKYREQMFRLLMASKKDDPSIITKLKEQHSKELQVHVDQITEMAAVMRKAIETDEKHGCKEQERIIQLELRRQFHLRFDLHSRSTLQTSASRPAAARDTPKMLSWSLLATSPLSDSHRPGQKLLLPDKPGFSGPSAA